MNKKIATMKQISYSGNYHLSSNFSAAIRMHAEEVVKNHSSESGLSGPTLLHWHCTGHFTSDTLQSHNRDNNSIQPIDP